jgi:hypothetical protein
MINGRETESLTYCGTQIHCYDAEPRPDYAEEAKNLPDIARFL